MKPIRLKYFWDYKVTTIIMLLAIASVIAFFVGNIEVTTEAGLYVFFTGVLAIFCFASIVERGKLADKMNEYIITPSTRAIFQLPPMDHKDEWGFSYKTTAFVTIVQVILFIASLTFITFVIIKIITGNFG